MSDNFNNLGLRHFRSSLDAQNISWLEINVANSSVNRLSAEVLQELDRALDYYYAAPLPESYSTLRRQADSSQELILMSFPFSIPPPRVKPLFCGAGQYLIV